MILNLSDNCLLVFIDETGHELLNDPVQKVFGLAGCAVISGSLDTAVRQPWRDVRRIVVGTPDAPLHAADHREPTRQQLDAVNNFFKKPFARFGAVCSVEARLDDPLTAMIIAGSGVAGSGAGSGDSIHNSIPPGVPRRQNAILFRKTGTPVNRTGQRRSPSRLARFPNGRARTGTIGRCSRAPREKTRRAWPGSFGAVPNV